jgi:hypothetical protein
MVKTFYKKSKRLARTCTFGVFGQKTYGKTLPAFDRKVGELKFVTLWKVFVKRSLCEFLNAFMVNQITFFIPSRTRQTFSNSWPRTQICSFEIKRQINKEKYNEQIKLPKKLKYDSDRFQKERVENEKENEKRLLPFCCCSFFGDGSERRNEYLKKKLAIFLIGTFSLKTWYLHDFNFAVTFIAKTQRNRKSYTFCQRNEIKI